MANMSLEHVYKKYGKVTAVTDFNLDIKDGEFIVFVGPSGCGKSTTLRMIAGLEEISDGLLKIDERIVNDVPPKDRDIAMVFQNYALYPHMNVYENMAFGLRLRKFPKDQIDKRVRDSAKILQIEHLLERKPKELSGGQRQRVALGRAIVREPKVFLMDEPLSNLDAKLRVEMRSQISKLHQRLKATTIYVTHDQIEAMTMGTRIVVMKDGFIQQVDTPLNLYDYPKNKFVAGFIGSPSMNFLTGTVKGDMITGEGFAVQATGTLGESLKAHNGKQVWFGIRPEHLGLEGSTTIAGGNNRMTGKVEVVEPLGAETDLIVDINGQTVVVKVDGHAQVKVGDTVNLFAEQSRLHAFDLQNELAIGR
jgi:multiple sugar transport system ATP-binding protein